MKKLHRNPSFYNTLQAVRVASPQSGVGIEQSIGLEFLDYTVGDLIDDGIRKPDDSPLLIHLNGKRRIINVGDYYLGRFHRFAVAFLMSRRTFRTSSA
jgi:hypothetical protein